jgi:hypothetical protein
VSNLFFSLLIGGLVAGAVFVVADKLRRLSGVGSAEVVAVPGHRSLTQSPFDSESQGQLAAANPFAKGGMKAALGVSVLIALGCVAWPYYTLHKLSAVAPNGNAAALEEQGGAVAEAESAMGAGSGSGTSSSEDGQQHTSPAVSGGSSGFINRVVPGFAIPFREYRWHQPVEQRAPQFGNRSVVAPHGGVQWRQPAPSYPTVASRAATTMASRPRH